MSAVTRLGLYGGSRSPYGSFAGKAVNVTATVSGGPFTAAQIVAGGEVITLTIVNDTWATGGDFDSAKGAIAGGFSGDGSWSLVEIAQALNSYAGIVRTSDTVITITLPPVAGYTITAIETVTVTVPGSARSDIESDPLAAGSFTVSLATVSTKPDGGGAGAKLYNRGKRYPRKVIIGGEVIWVRSLAEEMRLLAEYAAAQQAKLEALQETEAPAEEVRVQRIRVTKAKQRVRRRNEADEWLARLRAEDEEILLLLH